MNTMSTCTIVRYLMRTGSILSPTTCIFLAIRQRSSKSILLLADRGFVFPVSCTHGKSPPNLGKSQSRTMMSTHPSTNFSRGSPVRWKVKRADLAKATIFAVTCLTPPSFIQRISLLFCSQSLPRMFAHSLRLSLRHAWHRSRK